MTLELVLSTSVHINSFNLELGTCVMERKEIHRDTDDKWMFWQFSICHRNWAHFSCHANDKKLKL